jgi:hypothetical protein
MQFLVYVTVLMVSVSAVLLEVHWLTSPAPQLKPAIQAKSAPPPVPKSEGPNAALSPVYPKKMDALPLAESARNEPSPVTAQAPPVQQSAAAATVPTEQAATEPPATAAPPQRPATETTGNAAHEDAARQQAAAMNLSNRQETAAVLSGNHCDVQACSGAYRSFRASDCTYQPFDGARRVCEKPPVQRTAREREDSERRKRTRDISPWDVDRSTMGSRIDDEDDEGAADFDDDSERVVIRRLSPRW